jgi:NADH-quinone oxidoreductase subunit G
MVKIKINSQLIDVLSGTTVLQAALENGIFIPHFCWHPRLSVSGNCRMCAVQVEGRKKLEMSCNLPVEEGMVIHTDTKEVRETREKVLEFLLINHPLDCPICDQSGECLLQDYHFKYSGRAGRFREEKVKRPKAVDIGPHVKLDNERCILCSRCVRFCKEVARDEELCIARRGDRSYTTTAPGRKLDNPYSLCTVDICPVGALTSKDFRFKKRVWMLKSTPSVCPSCANLCRIWIDHTDGVIYRIRPHGDGVPAMSNGLLCDEGRLSYKTWRAPNRPAQPSARDAVAELSTVIKKYPMGKIAVVVSASCTCEEVDAMMAGFKGARFYAAGQRQDANFEDDIIRKKDRSPNGRYLKDKGIPPVADGVSGEALVIAGALTEEDTIALVDFRWRDVVHFIHDAARALPGAGLVLSVPAFSEMSGSFAGPDGEKRPFDAAFPPPRGAMEIKDWLKLCSI